MDEFFNTTQKIRLARSLFTKTSPAYIQFYITARCNLACEQCNIIYADADSQEMSIDQIRAMAKNMAEIGVCIVLLIFLDNNGHMHCFHLNLKCLIN